MSMETRTNTPAEIGKLQEKVEILHRSSQQMIHLMEMQIDAIIIGDPVKIEELSDLHASLSIQYSDHEREFITELTKVLGSVAGREDKVKLATLKKAYPNSATIIEGWQALLNNNLMQLQEKHNQIMELLDFALNRNARMMRNIYSAHNEKNTRYGSNGNRTAVMPGVAVNQEA